MANTSVLIRDEMGLRVPSLLRVPIAAQDSFTLSVEEGADSALYFSPQTAAILEPAPGPRVDLVFGQTVTFQFTSSGDGAYGLVIQAPEDPAPESFDFGPPAAPAALVIQPGQGLGFPVPINPTQTGGSAAKVKRSAK